MNILNTDNKPKQVRVGDVIHFEFTEDDNLYKWVSERIAEEEYPSHKKVESINTKAETLCVEDCPYDIPISICTMISR